MTGSLGKKRVEQPKGDQEGLGVGEGALGLQMNMMVNRDFPEK